MRNDALSGITRPRTNPASWRPNSVWRDVTLKVGFVDVARELSRPVDLATVA
jgi:hypothetical protein